MFTQPDEDDDDDGDEGRKKCKKPPPKWIGCSFFSFKGEEKMMGEQMQFVFSSSASHLVSLSMASSFLAAGLPIDFSL